MSAVFISGYLLLILHPETSQRFETGDLPSQADNWYHQPELQQKHQKLPVPFTSGEILKPLLMVDPVLPVSEDIL